MSVQEFEERLEDLEAISKNFTFLPDFEQEYERLLKQVTNDKKWATTATDKRACFVRAVNLRVLLARQVAWLTGIRESMAAQGEGHGAN